MSNQKDNIFGSYDIAEQQQIEAAVTGQPAVKKTRTGRPRKRKDATSITLIVSREDKEKMQAYAYDHAMTASDLLHKWISELGDD